MNVTKKIKVLVGMTGGEDSAVSAYLMKKQGYEVIGVSVVLHDKDTEELVKTCIPNMYIPDLNLVKQICDRIGITFFAVDASKDFKNIVCEKIIEKKLSGRSYSIEIEAHDLLLRILNDKLITTDAQKIVTGHFAKIFFEHSQNTQKILCPDDIYIDQSYLFGKTSSNIINNLICPLGDLLKNSVKKISKGLGKTFKKDIKKLSVARQERIISNYVNKNIPKDLKKEGSIDILEDDLSVGDHEGIHHFYLGQKKVQSIYDVHKIDPELMVIMLDSMSAKVGIGRSDLFITEGIRLSNFNFLDGVDLSFRQHIKFKIDNSHEFISGELVIKNNNNLDILFEKAQKNIKGQIVSVYIVESYSKMRLIGSGDITFNTNFKPHDRAKEFDNTNNKDKDKNVKELCF